MQFLVSFQHFCITKRKSLNLDLDLEFFINPLLPYVPYIWYRNIVKLVNTRPSLCNANLKVKFKTANGQFRQVILLPPTLTDTVAFGFQFLRHV